MLKTNAIEHVYSNTCWNENSSKNVYMELFSNFYLTVYIFIYNPKHDNNVSVLMIKKMCISFFVHPQKSGIKPK